MSKLKLGRPKGKTGLEKQAILEAALSLLDAKGSQGLSMRSLALSLKVTPMALYHHYSDRSSLLRSVSDMVYGEVTNVNEESSVDIREKLELLLTSYHKTVLLHPYLTISIFESPPAFSDEARRITQDITKLLTGANVSESKREVWLNILVDFTHGSSIATAMSSALNKNENDFVVIESKRYSKELKVLLDCIFH